MNFLKRLFRPNDDEQADEPLFHEKVSVPISLAEYNEALLGQICDINDSGDCNRAIEVEAISFSESEWSAIPNNQKELLFRCIENPIRGSVCSVLESTGDPDAQKIIELINERLNKLL